MHRRYFAASLLFTAVGPPAWAAAASPGRRPPGHFIAADQLQQAVDGRFPRRYPVAGMLDLELLAPRLEMRAASNRLAAELPVRAAGPALNRSHSGSLNLDFALRFERHDRSLRAHQLQLGRLSFPTLQPGVEQLLNTYAPALASQALQDVVLHQLSEEDLALPNRLGLQPGSITVLPDGLVVALVAKPL